MFLLWVTSQAQRKSEWKKVHVVMVYQLEFFLKKKREFRIYMGETGTEKVSLLSTKNRNSQQLPLE